MVNINGWKLTAIIFIILFVLETSLLFMAWNVGNNLENNKLECSNKICYELNSGSFLYDDATSTCYCYNGEEVIHKEYMK